MLKQLRISNIILIENVEIQFEEGLNILTGETGAGKSSIMQALSLALGERADSSIIRKDTSKAYIEAGFEIPHQGQILRLLSEAEINVGPGELLIIRREISSSGKNRSFINDQLAPLSLIESISSLLIDIVGQHSHQRLLSLAYHREILDAFGKHSPLLEEIAGLWNQESTIRSRLKDLIDNTPARLRDIDNCQVELEELQEARLRAGEEEELFQEYSRLSHADEIITKAKEVTSSLIDSRTPLLPQLQKQKSNLEHLTNLDPSLMDTFEAFKNSVLELEEASYTLMRYQEKMYSDPVRLAEVNERLTLINRLKRKYGNTLEEIENYRTHLQAKLAGLKLAEDRIPELQEQLEQLQERGEALTAQLSQKRALAAAQFEKQITNEIHSLNMPRAFFSIKITPQARGPQGADKIECYFSPNLGEQMIPLKECASGGELSRILLAIKTVLAGNDHVPTLIFDEIDANLGGETASIVGEKLNRIGKQYQVLCITHLPQVASQGNCHHQISKEEKSGRTVATVVKLDKETRRQELTRMLGGLSFSSATKELAQQVLKD